VFNDYLTVWVMTTPTGRIPIRAVLMPSV